MHTFVIQEEYPTDPKGMPIKPGAAEKFFHDHVGRVAKKYRNNGKKKVDVS